ncbi:MAG: hypothetical protein HY673_25785 [Chloroflexi bacterium]|nr:hypothetical protein [Chloroflexota bacterium]
MATKILNTTIEVYDPTGPLELTQTHAPRLDTLAGKTVGEVSNGMWEHDRIFPLIRRLLQERYPDIKFVPYTEFPEGSHEIQSERLGELAKQKGCQAVITGNAG